MPRKRSWRRSKIFSVVHSLTKVSLAGFFIGGLILISRFAATFFRIDKVICQTQTHQPCPPPIVAALSDIRGQSLLTFNASSQRESWQRLFPQIRSVVLRKVFPRTLVIDTVLSTPIMVIRPDNSRPSDPWYLINQEGAVVGQAASADLPPVPRLTVARQKWLFDNHVFTPSFSSNLTQLVYLLAAVEPVKEMSLNNEGDLTATVDGFEVILSSSKDPAVSVATLQLVLGDPTIGDSRPISIDIRFGNPVLSY